MKQDDQIKIVKRVSFIQYLTEDELRELVEHCNKIELNPGELLFEEGAAGHTMYIVISGEIEVFKKNTVIAHRGPSDFIGEMALIESEPRSASVRSVGTSLLLEIDEEMFLHHLIPNRRVVLEFVRTLSRRTREDLEIINTAYLKLQKSEEHYRSIVETTSDVIVNTNPDGIIVFVNTAIKMLGFEPADIIGQPIHALLKFPEDSEIWSDIMTKRVGDRATRDYEIPFELKDPSHPEAVTVKTMLLNSIGLWNVPVEEVMKKGSKKTFLGNLFVLRDITTRKQIIEMDKANQAKSEFLSRISHELRTPMNSILGFAQLLQMDAESLDKEHQSHVERILEAGDHLHLLINELLDLSKIELGKLTLNYETVNANKVVEETISIVQPLADLKNVRLENNLSKKDSFSIEGDRTRIKQVLMNLLSNAIKYNRPGGKVTVDGELDGNDTLKISITDTGMGISKEGIQSLFLPFNRLVTDEDQIEGTGIGLTISKDLMELMGGSIHVHSTQGEGSCFEVKIPVNPATE